MGKNLVLPFFFTLFAGSSALAGWIFSTDNTLESVYRAYPEATNNFNYLDDGYFESLTGVKYEGRHWSMEAKFLLRSLQSESNTYPDDISYTDLRPPNNRLFKLATQLDKSGYNQTELDAGTLWLSYSAQHWQFTVGRRPLGIGVLKMLPIWNRLTAVLPTISGYILNQNPDIVDLRWQYGPWTMATYSVLAQLPKDQIQSAELIYYGSSLESHLLASNWWQQPAAGWAGVVDWGGASWRMESLFVGQTQDMPSGWQVGGGWEKAWTGKFSTMIEYVHSSFGASNEADYFTKPSSPFRFLLASDYVYPEMTYQWTDFWKMSLGALVNMIDGSTMGILETSYSMNDHVDLIGSAHIPIGGANQEFGYLPDPRDTTQNIQYAQWISAGLKVSF